MKSSSVLETMVLVEGITVSSGGSTSVRCALGDYQLDNNPPRGA